MQPNQPDPNASQAVTLLHQVAALGARPFLQEVVESPWAAVLDAEELHSEAKTIIQNVVSHCHEVRPRCVTIAAPSGFGKTHLLAWTRNWLETAQIGWFIWIPPYGVGPGSVSPERHILRAVLDSLSANSRSQRERFSDVVRVFLVAAYDQIVNSRTLFNYRWIRRTLRIESRWGAWTDLVTGRYFQDRIGHRQPGEQREALERALDHEHFLEAVFAGLEQHPSGQFATRPTASDWDRDTLVAVSLFACGNQSQRQAARRWFHGEVTQDGVLGRFGVREPIQGKIRLRNSLITLSRLLGQPLCLAFDQLEDTVNALRTTGQPIQALQELLDLSFIRALSDTPGFALLFSFQLDVWSLFSSAAQSMLIDRMTEDYGPQLLKPLDEATAQAVAQRRLESLVWHQLDHGACPPAGMPCFPFQSAQITTLLNKSQGVLRGFLRRLQEEWNDRVVVPEPIQLSLTAVEPSPVPAGEPVPIQIRGQHLPAAVRISFGDLNPVSAICDQEQGIISVTTPAEGLAGTVVLRVVDADNTENAATISLEFAIPQIPQPYYEHVDAARFRQCRQQRGMTAKQVAEAIVNSAGRWSPRTAGQYICNLENGRYAPDDFVERLATFYGLPLAHFRCQPTAGGVS